MILLKYVITTHVRFTRMTCMFIDVTSRPSDRYDLVVLAGIRERRGNGLVSASFKRQGHRQWICWPGTGRRR